MDYSNHNRSLQLEIYQATLNLSIGFSLSLELKVILVSNKSSNRRSECGGNHVEFHTSPIKELIGACQKLLNIRLINKFYL